MPPGSTARRWQKPCCRISCGTRSATAISRDLHPGNIFADPKTGNIVAVDFGIMGRITRRESRFLAGVVYGFITRNYRAMAQLHFDMGYVPKTQSVDDFALALRAIGEPLHGRKASAISMATVFGQLFTTTELFDMEARPELC